MDKLWVDMCFERFLLHHVGKFGDSGRLDIAILVKYQGAEPAAKIKVAAVQNGTAKSLFDTLSNLLKLSTMTLIVGSGIATTA